MLFHSHTFLLLFLPAVLLVWWQPLPARVRLAFLAGASYLFYAWWDWRFVFLMLGTTVVDYVAGRAIFASEGAPRRRWLLLSLAFNLGMLGFFKYFDFFAASTNAVLGTLGLPDAAPLLHLALPIGISFYLFESITYTVDIYRGAARPAESFLHYAVFVSIFPKLVAGPIIRYSDVEEQYRALPSRVDWEQMHRGIWFFVVGMAKKLLIADALAGQINPLFAHARELGFTSGWGALLGYSFQIYFDFSAYSDMAVGLGFMLGFRFPRNFDRPYLARNVSEFWERWHITLSRWLRDYLFIPLGGSRGTRAQTARNLLVTMFLGGLWHGASWTFVLWGLYHCALLAGYHGCRALRRPRWEVCSPWPGRAACFLLVTLGWLLFRSADLPTAGAHMQALAGMRGLRGAFPAAHPLDLGMLIAAAAAWVLFVPEVWEWRPAPRRRWAFALAAVMVVCIAHLGAPSPFLYFQF